ncbi:hypothetical protein KIH27_02040 [Mycobacterium sp. M1]|uniref:Uncharacterized protein n=1 Tax=Mycolicibacter acidiphilus TaxID=2835306 RepID=A0ABS5RDL8_9MYCO|nr:hypothetical protein [Mycolicibacter acidiphilus]MBS9532365.1 hypothetical protein [Mycolicibacter acidiphilus]
METVLKAGVPEVCVLVKNLWQGPDRDPSAERRAGLRWLLADALVTAGVPVAEIPLLTLSTFIGSSPVPGRRGADAIVSRLKEAYPRLEIPGQGFRGTTAAAAVAGAMACGIETLIPVTSDRLKILAGAGNRGIQWPPSLKPPATLGEWARLNANETTPANLAG